MNFKDALLVCLKEKYADFTGRARRSEYWYFVVLSFATSLIAQAMPTLGGILSLLILVPSLAVSVRRLHDVGKSGWFVLAAIVPILGALYLIYLTIQDSEPEANQWGPNPKI